VFVSVEQVLSMFFMWCGIQVNYFQILASNPATNNTVLVFSATNTCKNSFNQITAIGFKGCCKKTSKLKKLCCLSGLCSS